MIEVLQQSHHSQDFPSMSWRHYWLCCLTFNCFSDATSVNDVFTTKSKHLRRHSQRFGLLWAAMMDVQYFYDFLWSVTLLDARKTFLFFGEDLWPRDGIKSCGFRKGFLHSCVVVLLHGAGDVVRHRKALKGKSVGKAFALKMEFIESKNMDATQDLKKKKNNIELKKTGKRNISYSHLTL